MDSYRGFARVLLAIGAVFLLVVGVMPAAQSRSPGLPAVSVQKVTLDEAFGQVARQVPAFGGMYVQGDTLRVYLTNPSDEAAVVQTIKATFGTEQIPAGGVEVVQATYGFQQLSAWHARIGGLFNLPGVIMTDIDETSNRLKVGVDSAATASAVETNLARLSIPRTAVNIVEMQPFALTESLRDQIRPIEGGTQIAFSVFLCTLGFNGVREGVEGFVVNSHCTDVQGGVTGTEHYQPTIAGDTFIGTEIADPLYTPDKCPLLLIGHVCRYSDSAYDERDPGVTADQGLIAQPDSVDTGSLTIAGQFRIVSEGASTVGDVVNKVGRTTGWTQGEVTDTCADVLVFGSLIVQRCQEFVSAGVGAGDSGSPVFAITSGDDVELRGILWGGTLDGTQFVYSPIANIERVDELGPIATCAAGFSC